VINVASSNRGEILLVYGIHIRDPVRNMTFNLMMQVFIKFLNKYFQLVSYRLKKATVRSRLSPYYMFSADCLLAFHRAHYNTDFDSQCILHGNSRMIQEQWYQSYAHVM
jgi:hypothetical protein